MKKLALLFTVMLFGLNASAQEQFRIWQGGEFTKVKLANAGDMTYGSNGTTVSIAGTTYQTATIDSIVPIHQILVAYSGTSATVSIPAAVASDVTATVSGGHVTVTNTNVSNEMEFILSGTSANGSFTYNGSYKTTIRLNGVSLTSQQGAALDIQCGKRIALVLEDGTENTLSDYASGTQKAAFYCKGHMEVEGGGTLNVTGNLKHAIQTKEYLQLKKSTGTINILGAASDGIHCGEFFTMNGGSLSISGHAGDGLQMEMAKSSDEENNGIFTMNGGSIKVTHTAAGSKAIRADSTLAVMNINGGTINIDMASKATDAKGLVCDGNINISQSSSTTAITINVASAGYKDSNDEKIRSTGMKSDGTVTLNEGNVTIKATGTYARGMRAATLIVNGGTLTVTNTGSGSQGIKLDNTIVKNGGTVTANFKYS